MSSPKQAFDTDRPNEPVRSEDKTFPAGKVPQQRPVAATVTETAKSQQEREEIAKEIRAENDALAHEHIRMRRAGLVMEQIPLDKVATFKLTRDRSQKTDLEIDELVTSIREVGLSNPIRVEEASGGTYELIQGFRRLQAYKHLLSETGDAETWGAIPAGVMPKGDTLHILYRRMVDENLIRKDISFAEMAALAIEYALDPETQGDDPNKVVAKLFSSASYQKRSYIRSFIRLMEPLRGVLDYPHDIPRSLGLALANRIEADAQIAQFVADDLKGWDNRSVADELGVLRRYAGGYEEDIAAAGTAKTFPAGKVSAGAGSKAKTSFELRRPEGKATCVAGAGRIDIKLDRDFSAIDRKRLERAVRTLLDQLG